MAQLRRTARTRSFLIYHLPALLYAAAIIVLSSIPQFKPPHVGFLPTDKLAHFAEYAIFAYLTFRSVSHLGRRFAGVRAVLVSALFLTVFAAGDELHQHFIPGRQADVYDLIGDLLGGFVVLAHLWRRSAKDRRALSQP